MILRRSVDVSSHCLTGGVGGPDFCSSGTSVHEWDSDFFWAATDDFVAGSFLVGFEVLEEKISELASAGIEGGLVGPAVAGNENV